MIHELVLCCWDCLWAVYAVNECYDYFAYEHFPSFVCFPLDLLWHFASEFDPFLWWGEKRERESERANSNYTRIIINCLLFRFHFGYLRHINQQTTNTIVPNSLSALFTLLTINHKTLHTRKQSLIIYPIQWKRKQNLQMYMCLHSTPSTLILIQQKKELKNYYLSLKNIQNVGLFAPCVH